MAHAAHVVDGIVREVIVVPDDLGGDESDAAITAYCNSLGLTGTWVRTSYNAGVNGFRGKYAGQGDSFDGEEFVPPPAPDPVFPEGA